MSGRYAPIGGRELDPVERLVDTLIYENTRLSPNVATALMKLAEYVLADPHVAGLEHWSNLHALARAQVTMSERWASRRPLALCPPQRRAYALTLRELAKLPRGINLLAGQGREERPCR